MSISGTDHAVKKIRQQNGRTVVSGNHFQETFEMEADAVVVTVPVSLLIPGSPAVLPSNRNCRRRRSMHCAEQRSVR